ncbi:MAG: ferredoxin [Candidatus Odinarchaeia archaeon]
MAKVKVNQELCIACGSCIATCEDVYEEGEDGKAKVVDKYQKELNAEFSVGEIPDNLKDCANEGAGICPVDAIEIE